MTDNSDILSIIQGAANKYGDDPAVLTAIARIEDPTLDPAAANPNSSARGLFQFTSGTGAQYGLTDPIDPAAAADAGARLMRDNIAYLRDALGREPTAGEVYLAHQQGAPGAVALLQNPTAPAAAVVGEAPVVQNGGQQGMTAADFTRLWTSRVNDLLKIAPQATQAAAVAPSSLTAQFAPQATQAAAVAAVPDTSALLTSISAPQPTAAPVAGIGQLAAAPVANAVISDADARRRRLSMTGPTPTLANLYA